jgi:hypothetical protein
VVQPVARMAMASRRRMRGLIPFHVHPESRTGRSLFKVQKRATAFCRIRELPEPNFFPEFRKDPTGGKISLAKMPKRSTAVQSYKNFEGDPPPGPHLFLPRKK